MREEGKPALYDPWKATDYVSLPCSIISCENLLQVIRKPLVEAFFGSQSMLPLLILTVPCFALSMNTSIFTSVLTIGTALSIFILSLCAMNGV